MSRYQTPLKQLIVELLTAEHLLTAPQLLTKLAAQNYHFNKTSLYRALESLMAEDKLCRHLLSAANEAAFELRDHHHDHAVCSTCGKIVSIECDVQLPTIANFQPDHHHLTVFGQCQTCVSNSNISRSHQ